jgi:hypothetical protein
MLPGVMWAVLAPTAVINSCTALATNSGHCGTNVLGHAAQDEQIRERVDDIDGFQLPVDKNGQTFMGKLVDDVQPLRRTMLPQHTANPSLGQFQPRSNMIDTGSATRGA